MSTQFQALEDIINLAIEDPLARVMLAQHDVEHYLASKYKEQDLFLATSKALNAIENEKVHALWSGVLLGRMSEFPEEVVNLYTTTNISDSDFSVDGKTFYRQSLGVFIEELSGGLDAERYIRLYNVDKYHSYFRELRMSLRFVSV